LARAERPDLLVTDIVMRVIDGFELARQVRADPALADIPIIFCTAMYLGAETRRLAQACGVTHILAKPAQPQVILEAVDAALRTANHRPAAPILAEFQREHLRVLTDVLARKVAELEAEVVERQALEAALERSQAAAAGELQTALADQREVLRTLSARLGEADERARRRLSAELHDRVGQSLTTLGLMLSLVRGQLAASGDQDLMQRLDEAQNSADEVATEVRDVMAVLRPPVLDDYGLRAALHAHAARLAETSQLPIEIRGEELSPRLSRPVETALFRVAQEALNNVVRHAHAQHVTISLEAEARTARLTVADDGRGFSPQLPRGLGERARWGLLIMRERMETAGGTMRIDTKPGQGTRIILEVVR
jgi:signal transduction histidine kinase